MSTYSLQVPDGLKPYHCERPGGDYSDLPIRYVMPQISEDEIVKAKIKLPDGNTHDVTIFEQGNAEMYIRTMKDHENLVELKGSETSIKEAKELVYSKHALFQTTNAVVNPTQSQRALALTRLKDKKDAQLAYFKIVTAAFSLFRRVLAGGAREHWDNIDQEVHGDDTYTALNSATCKGPRQRSWESFQLCLAKHKLVVFNQDAADLTRRYLQQGIRKPHEVKIKFFMQRVQAINRDLAFMPCLALYTQASNEVVPTNIPFNGTEMCDIILRSLPSDWQAQYKVSNGQDIPTKPELLVRQLEAIEKIMDHKPTDKIPRKESPGKSGKNDRGSEKRRSNNGPGTSPRIPKKQKSEKFCNRCKDKGGRYQTHNTDDCAKYDADGTLKKSFGSKYTRGKGSKGGKGQPNKKWGQDKQQISHLTAALDKVKKQMKKLKKTNGKKRKRQSRHHSSDESSSGSDSE